MNPIGRDPHSADFFDAAARNVFKTKFCLDCASWSEPSALTCSCCQRSRLEWKITAGIGQIVSWVIIPPGKKARAGAPNTVVALVELTEGPWVTMSVADNSIPKSGQPVSIGFQTPAESEAIPVAILK